MSDAAKKIRVETVDEQVYVLPMTLTREDTSHPYTVSDENLTSRFDISKLVEAEQIRRPLWKNHKLAVEDVQYNDVFPMTDFEIVCNVQFSLYVYSEYAPTEEELDELDELDDWPS